MDDRRELLAHMYDQLFNDIDRHILVVWQSVGVLVAAFAIFSLTEKEIITLDVATSLILLLSGWLLAHLIDAGYWYNRNLCMIANIEKEFLLQTDLKDIHYYMGQHRPKNKMITHLRIQGFLAFGLSGIVLVFHFIERVYPGMVTRGGDFEFIRSLPYLMILIATLYLLSLRKKRNIAYQEFLSNSPGKKIDTSGIKYGIGHGFKEEKEKLNKT